MLLINSILGNAYRDSNLKEKIEKSLTVYDSTGLAIEDIAIAEAIYEKIK